MSDFNSGYEQINEVYGLVESLGLPVISRPNQTSKILKIQNFKPMITENQQNIYEWRKKSEIHT